MRLSNTLQIKRTANVIWNSKEEFEFKIYNSPQALENAILDKVTGGQSTGRLVAGFCWKWSDPNADGTLVDDVVVGDFARPWNAKSTAGRLASGIPPESLWAYHPQGAKQIGCIYTAQGFEFEYVGVIFGKDLVYDASAAAWRGEPKQSFDKVVSRAPGDFLKHVKNAYRVLLTRGLRGCYVCFVDRDTENFFRSRIED